MNEQTLEKMSRMRLLGMYAAFKTCLEDNRTEQFTNDEPVEHPVNSEWDDRRNRTLQRALKYARFRLSGNARTDGLQTGQRAG